MVCNQGCGSGGGGGYSGGAGGAQGLDNVHGGGGGSYLVPTATGRSFQGTQAGNGYVTITLQ
jgi:hypothetical protein